MHPHEHEANVVHRLAGSVAPQPRRTCSHSSPPPARPRVLAFFTAGGELDHFLFAQQAMRAFGTSAERGRLHVCGHQRLGQSQRRKPPGRAARDLAERHASHARPSGRHSSGTWPGAAPGWDFTSPVSATTPGRGSPSSWVAADSQPATGRRCRPASTLTMARTRS